MKYLLGKVAPAFGQFHAKNLSIWDKNLIGW